MFCERQLAGGALGAIEHDLEHFRPKSRVRKWPAISSQPRIYFSTGEESPRGYYWLAYHPLNYGAACKVCNTMLKRDYFPIAGVRAEPTDSFADLRTKEQPDLIYPIGDADGDPESLISFIGIVPVPVKKTGPRNRRARVTIAFFDLQKREELRRERSEQLVTLDNAFFKLNHGSIEEQEHTAMDIERLSSSSSRHASCVRAACKLYSRDVDSARAIFQAVRGFLSSSRRKS